MKHSNIALFVAHQGCPHQCSFCNQKTISGKLETATPQEVIEAAEIAKRSLGENSSGAEISFFGGSFTAIERDYMISLLKAAYPYIKDGTFKGIRASTRPDAINEEILSILKEYGVTALELGAQSMNDEVLKKNMRGHTAKQVEEASEMIKSFSIELGLQMMTGLYGDDDEGAVRTAEKIIEIKPSTVRIYPTVVLENTFLARLYKEGKYKPQTLDEAVFLCSRLLKMFEQSNINVIRLGLHSGGNVEEGYLAGAYHPAFRELCESKIYYENAKAYIEKNDISEGQHIIYVCPKGISAMTGQHRQNIEALKSEGFDCKIKSDSCLKKYEVVIQ
ncbi:MAG: radical SAM protein [Clostridiales bacterium]|nr:radical SAM protein [Clostridiales bacterium]